VAQLLPMEGVEHTHKHRKKQVHSNNNTTEQTTGEQVNARKSPLPTRGAQQVTRRASSALRHKSNEHKRRCWQLFLTFKNVSTSNERIFNDATRTGDENSTRRTRRELQQATQPARARTRNSAPANTHAHSHSICTQP
jgi:hypothetical protein